MLINGVCLVAALVLTPFLVPGSRMPGAGMALALVSLLFVRTLAPAGPTPYWRHVWLYLPGQAVVAGVCLAAGRLFWNWPWPVYSFLPLWIGLTWLALLRHDHWRKLAPVIGPLLSPGGQTALTGGLLVGAAAFLYGRLATLAGFSWSTILALAIGWLVIDRLPVLRWQDATDGRSRLARFILRLLLWATGVGVAAVLLGADHGRSQTVCLLAITGALACYGLTHRRRLVAGPENAARTLLGLFAAFLIHPFACHRLLGSQDAQWYMNTLADFLAQFRAGIFPIFAGQSEHLFNGGVLPVRFAPLFQHYGLLLDILTLQTLPSDALQNGVIVACFVGAAFTSQAMLIRILPDRPWLTAGLSALFLSCPGVLAIAYYDNLFMTWTTLPWLPVVFGGCVLSFRSNATRPQMLAGGALGLIWWGHSPVALWTTLAVVAVHGTRLVVLPPREWPWRSLFQGGAVFTAIALYPLISVLAVPMPGGTGAGNLDYPATELLIRINHFIRESFPGILVPPFAKSRSVSDYQLGWALLLLLGLSAGAMIRRRVNAPGPWILLAVPTALQLLLLPIPGVTSFFWSVLPGILVNPTGIWPMQRLYVIMAACIVCAAADLMQGNGGVQRPVPVWLSCLLAAGLFWSALAAAPIVQMQSGQRRVIALATDVTRPENHVLTRYSYLFFGRQPGYYSHGHVDPLYEQRFLSMDGRRWIGGNPNAILADTAVGQVVSEGPLTARIVHDGDPWQITPRFTLEPHKRYALELHFNHATKSGILMVNGGEIDLNYGLPRYGEKFSFGSGPDSSPLLPLHTTGDEPVEIALRFVSQQPGSTTGFENFGSYRWLEINPQALPIRVTSWIPYQAEVNAPAGVWLETPRMFQTGYRAAVNGQPVTPESSPEGLVSVPLPAGRSSVVVSYHPPLLLRLGYWISLATVLACVGMLIRESWRPVRPA